MANKANKQFNEASLVEPARPAEKLVTRVVIGPKPLYTTDPDSGEPRVAQIGETVRISERTAIAFAIYLEDPKLAAAKAAVIAIEAAEDANDADSGDGQ